MKRFLSPILLIIIMIITMIQSVDATELYSENGNKSSGFESLSIPYHSGYTLLESGRLTTLNRLIKL